MSGPLGSSQWMYASGEDYTIDQSLRFNDDDSAYLTRTAGTPTSARIGTFSVWVKPCGLNGADQSLFGSYTSSSNRAYIRLHTDGHINMYDPHSSSGTINIKSTPTYRDPSAWMHILIAIDATQGTSSNRVKIYVNGVQVTDFTSEIYPDNVDQTLFKDGNTYAIGASQDSSFGRYLDGYLAEYHFIDGTALTPSSFGETGTYGEWKPIEYDTADGAYGTNGFYLSFAGGGVMSATGGTITTDGDYKVHSFTADGTFTPTLVGEVEYLVIAGGGGGGASRGGGGGAGGYRTGYLAVAKQAYSITVGDGGAGGPSGEDDGAKGSNSVFSSITSEGGGLGRGYKNPTANGGDGGSGGGAGGSEGTPKGVGGSATAGQGNDGGDTVSQNVSGGGGGAGGAGQTSPSTTQAGAGGAGLASSITGSSVTRAGGGGGSRNDNAGGAGGSGGGGTGGGDNYAVGGDGTANTGSGGGGGGSNGGDGGSGIVILRYKFQ